MPNERVKLQATAQAKYMSFLAELAYEQALAKKSLAFDPQGRVLVEVSLTDKQLESLIDDITNKAGNKSDVREENLKILADLLGKKVSPSTTVSLDCPTDDLKEKFDNKLDLKEKFDNQLKGALKGALKNNKASDLLAQTLIKKLNETPKGSIIALQQEFDFHLALVARVYRRHTSLKDKELREIHDKSMTEVNKLVTDAYAKALIASEGDRSIDVAKLNQLLDKARKDILPKAHQLMAKEFIKKLPSEADQEKITALSSSKLKHQAEKITATANDILHLDNEQGLATLIAGSDQTAHNKTKGADFAHRQLITHNLVGVEVQAQQDPRIQIRTPSIGSATTRIFRSSSEAPYVADVAAKLETIRKDYQLNERLDDSLNKPRSFNYNLHTAINHTLDDLQGKNLQSQSAIHILKGAHEYNAEQIARSYKEEGYEPVLCYVQNISVNGFGDELGYNRTAKSLVYAIFNPEGNKLRKEATLMTELSMLNTIYDAVSEDHQRRIQEVIGQYKSFLEDRKGQQFFSDSPEGNAVIKTINYLKMDFNQHPPEPSNDVHINAKLALRSLMASNLHFKHDYAKLTQALSVFSEPASISGCKSGNERAQAINGRVAVFDSLTNGQPLAGERKAVAQALKSLAEAKTPEAISECTEALNSAMHKAYNDKGLQGAASIISLVDQGASAKVEAIVSFAKSAWKSFQALFSANYGEENAAIMTNLHQDKAGRMQAHKGLGEQMKKAFAAEVQVAAISRGEPVGNIEESYSKTLDVLSAGAPPPRQHLHSIVQNMQSSAPAAAVTAAQVQAAAVKAAPVQAAAVEPELNEELNETPRLQ